VHDSMRIGWGRGGGDDGGCHGRYITAATKLMHPSMRSAHTLCSLPHTQALVYRYIFIGKPAYDSKKRRVTKRKARPKLQRKQFTEITEASGCG
jgi:hypothetical protein